jgi:hypothetical protein
MNNETKTQLLYELQWWRSTLEDRLGVHYRTGEPDDIEDAEKHVNRVRELIKEIEDDKTGDNQKARAE